LLSYVAPLSLGGITVGDLSAACLDCYISSWREHHSPSSHAMMQLSLSKATQKVSQRPRSKPSPPFSPGCRLYDFLWTSGSAELSQEKESMNIHRANLVASTAHPMRDQYPTCGCRPTHARDRPIRSGSDLSVHQGEYLACITWL
jgi:hypothetical protein